MTEFGSTREDLRYATDFYSENIGGDFSILRKVASQLDKSTYMSYKYFYFEYKSETKNYCVKLRNFHSSKNNVESSFIPISYFPKFDLKTPENTEANDVFLNIIGILDNNLWLYQFRGFSSDSNDDFDIKTVMKYN